MGKINKVTAVAVNKPPMITTANGREVSARSSPARRLPAEA